MNERIKELAEQIWDSLIDEMGDVVSEDGKLNWNFLHTYDQRFAKLILFECIKLAVFKGDKETARAIKQHFGVEL